MGLTIYQIDSFTNKPFAGNPAGVCILAAPADESWMQNVAMEMNLSETAFLYKQKDGFNLRWFTPAAEVELCGHATLASAHILWETGILAMHETARFHTLSGLLTARFKNKWIELDFPATPAESIDTPQGLTEALGITPKFVGKNKFDFLIEVDSEETVRRLEPDFSLLKSLTERGVMVTAPASSDEYDFISRFFAPSVGVDEDPVTGSAHCTLGPYWQKQLGKKDFTAYQASKRGGVVRVNVKGDRVILSGQAVTILRAEIVN